MRSRGESGQVSGFILFAVVILAVIVAVVLLKALGAI